MLPDDHSEVLVHTIEPDVSAMSVSARVLHPGVRAL